MHFKIFRDRLLQIQGESKSTAMTPAAQPLQCAGRTSLSEAATGAPGGIGFLIRTGSALPLVNHVPHWCHNLQVIIPPFFRRRPKIIISSWYSYDTPIKLYPRVYWLVKPCHVKPWWIPTVGPRASKQSIFTSWSVEMSMGDTPQTLRVQIKSGFYHPKKITCGGDYTKYI